ncbi:MAG: hypothetical protein NC110_05405 [Ruminococcus sp.]|nr:hypothetical protein [Ruminococcus sp.]
MNNYQQINQVAKPNGIVFLGSSYLHELPLCELAQDFETDLPVHNRSIDGMTIENVCDNLESCVVELDPSKVFISIGDEDVKNPELNVEKFIEKYQWLLYTLHNRSKAKIYIVSVLSPLPAASLINEKLKKLARETGCQYIDAAQAIRAEKPMLRLFDILRIYMRNHPITFREAMRV